MGHLPVLKPREVCRRLEALGFVLVRQRGSHLQYRHSDG
jgi:predicted RNA binding protein YcfA (HicA-like mRNA interferase family)